MEIGLQHEQHSKTGQNGGSKVCEHRKCCLRWQLPTAMDVGKVKGSPSYNKSVTFLPLASLFSLSALARARRRRRMPSYCFGFT